MDHELSEPKGEKQKEVWEGRLGGPGKGGEQSTTGILTRPGYC